MLKIKLKIDVTYIDNGQEAEVNLDISVERFAKALAEADTLEQSRFFRALALEFANWTDHESNNQLRWIGEQLQRTEDAKLVFEMLSRIINA
jgi:hypothetical protein